MPDGRDGRTRARGDRLTDREIAALVARIEQGRDRFDDALDDRLKQAVLREPWGEVNVADFSAEAEQLLAHAAALQATLAGLRVPVSLNAWTPLATAARDLAAAYRMPWPPAR